MSNAAADLLESDVDLLLSMASLWEIAIKVSLNKLTLPDDYERFMIMSGLSLSRSPLTTLRF
ncbi:PIN domain-containing protein [Leptothermofonsia sichuanensis]|uniref:hypothetical protein n=1 Tax=Leptothermofonsia sichuanensis TaxID=2917832 RepID=UPI0036F30365